MRAPKKPPKLTRSSSKALVKPGRRHVGAQTEGVDGPTPIGKGSVAAVSCIPKRLDIAPKQPDSPGKKYDLANRRSFQQKGNIDTPPPQKKTKEEGCWYHLTAILVHLEAIRGHL